MQHQVTSVGGSRLRIRRDECVESLPEGELPSALLVDLTLGQVCEEEVRQSTEIAEALLHEILFERKDCCEACHRRCEPDHTAFPDRESRRCDDTDSAEIGNRCHPKPCGDAGNDRRHPEDRGLDTLHGAEYTPRLGTEISATWCGIGQHRQCYHHSSAAHAQAQRLGISWVVVVAAVTVTDTQGAIDAGSA